MKNKYILLDLLFLCAIPLISYAGNNKLDKIKQNYKMLLLPDNEKDSLQLDLIRVEQEQQVSDQTVVELHQKYPNEKAEVENILSLQQEDGSWKDVDYTDKTRSGWKPKTHADRVLILAKQYNNPKSSFFHSEIVKTAIHKALASWYRMKLICPNWWYNQIGIPKTMGEAFILLEDQLSPEELQGAIEVMNHAKFGMTGQNKVWLAGNVLIRALLQNDEELVKQARDVIASEIVTGQREGIKNDWSFHQHGPQLQFGNYGLSFLSSMSFYYGMFKGTDYQFNGRDVQVLTNLINEGYRWIIWKRKMDVNSLGRQFFHNAQIHKAYTAAFSAETFDIGFPRTANLLVGQKHFDDSDYTVHRSKNWMASVRMSSSRVKGAELVNEDNLKGKYLGDGATYFYVNGNEYLNVYPFWYWSRIPGVTAYASPNLRPEATGLNRDALNSELKEAKANGSSAEKIAAINAKLALMNWSNNKSSLVGGLTNGRVGLSAMQLDRDGLKAYKAWLITDDYVLCFGNGIQSDSTLQVTTDIDQRVKVGDLMILAKNKWTTIQHQKLSVSDKKGKGQRFFHDQTGYIVLGNGSLTAEVESRKARWCDVMGMYDPKDVQCEVMDIYLEHGSKPQGASYEYIVLPATTPDGVQHFITKNIRILRNDAKAQIVQTKSAGEGYWAACYESGTLDIEGKTFNIEAPGIYYLPKNTTEKMLSNKFRLK